MKKNERAAAIVRTIVVSLIAVLFVVPLVWMLLSSLKTAPEVFARPFHWLPAKAQWQNYATVWMNEEASMLRAFANTLYIALFSIVGQMFISSLAAYSFAKINFKGKQVVFMLFLSSMMVPSQLTIIPRFMLFKTIGLYNNLWAIILPAFFGATSIFMLRQFYMGLPNDLIEAAKIDGASDHEILFKIKLPMVMPSVTICTFLTLTNSFKLFDQNVALTAGEPANASEMLALNIYNTFYGRSGAQWKGIGQAKAVIFFLIVVVISMIQLHFTRSKEVQQ